MNNFLLLILLKINSPLDVLDPTINMFYDILSIVFETYIWY